MKARSHRVSLVPITFRAGAAERGTLRAPVCHAEPGGAALELPFVRLAGAPDGVPLVFLTGGPGLSGIRSGRGRLFPMFDALRAHGDVILLDQRACVAGELVTSGPVPQPFGHELHTRDDYLREIGRTIRHAAGVLAKEGIPAHALNTNESADDVSMLVRALYGDDAVASLLGWSYGSHLAMAIMKRHEGMVTRAVLAAPEGPNHTLKRPRLIQDHLERLSRRAPADVMGMLSRVLDRAERESPLVFVSTDSPAVGRFDLQWIISELAADTRALRRLPLWLDLMEHGNFHVIGEDRLLRGAWEALRGELPFSVARYAMDCASGATAARLALIEREARETLLGNAIDFPLPDVCDAVGCPDLGDEFRAPPRSHVPVLFLTGTLDCRTPAENVADLAPGLPNHTHVVVEDAGHGDLLLPAGVQAAIVRFIGGGPVANHIKTDTPFVFDAT
jgi:pimeloyl-ACP methyl ester carboxylesterase